MASMAVEAVIILLLILANGVLAMTEIAIITARQTRLEQLANAGNHGAKTALALVEDPTNFLSTIQVGITLVTTIAAAFGGATLAEEVEEMLRASAVFGPYAEFLSVAIVVAAISYLSLVFGELAPKRLALDRAEHIACFMAQPMMLLSKVVSPVVALLSRSTELVLKLLGASSQEPAPVSEEEIKVIFEQGTKSGVLEHGERKILEEVLSFNDKKVSQVMTPRTEVVWLDESATWDEFLQTIEDSKHSFFPLCEGNIDKIIGIVDVRKTFPLLRSPEPVQLKQLAQHPLLIPENKSLLSVLELFRETHSRIAIVVGEYGDTMGLVSFHDIISALVGEVTEEGETPRWQATQREDGSWLIDGMMPIDDFKEQFNIKALPEEEESGYNTLGGFIVHQLEHIPSVAETMTWGALTFEIVDMDGYRVDKVLVRPAPDVDENPASGSSR